MQCVCVYRHRAMYVGQISIIELQAELAIFFAWHGSRDPDAEAMYQRMPNGSRLSVRNLSRILWLQRSWRNRTLAEHRSHRKLLWTASQIYLHACDDVDDLDDDDLAIFQAFAAQQGITLRPTSLARCMYVCMYVLSSGGFNKLFWLLRSLH
jgi:ribosomal protein L24E